MPTPTIPKRTLSLGACNRDKAIKGSGSSRMEPPIREAPAIPALLCKNSRREESALLILQSPLVLLTASACIAQAPSRSAHNMNRKCAIGCGNRLLSLFFYAASHGLSSLHSSSQRFSWCNPCGLQAQILTYLERARI